MLFRSHTHNKVEDWIIEHQRFQSGTGVFMKLSNITSRTTKQIFDHFTSGDDYRFTKTVVPVRLAQYGDDKLVSRSQAKRLLDRIDKFKSVIFDFDDVESIGRSFADEVFRVFTNQHPEMKLIYLNTNKVVRQMIIRSLNRE